MDNRDRIIELLGKAGEGFKPKPDDSKTRIEDLEEAVMELAEIITEVANG